MRSARTPLFVSATNEAFTFFGAGLILITNNFLLFSNKEVYMLSCFYPGMPMSAADAIIAYGVKVFLLAWIIFVPIVITSRLERIIKLLEKNK